MTDKKVITYTKPLETESEHLGFIKDFELCFPKESEVDPNTPRHLYIILFSLFSRLCTAKESFLALMDKKFYADAFVIAGTFLEIISVFKYIDLGKDLDEKTERADKYRLQSVFQEMLNNLDREDNPHIPENVIRETHLANIHTIKSLGILALKENPTKTHNSECIKYLTSRKFSNKDKRKYLNEHYRISKPDDYIKNFIKTITMSKTQKEQAKMCITEFYKQYCKIKHGNLLIWTLDIKEKDKTVHIGYGNMKTVALWAITIILFGLGQKYNKNEIKADFKSVV